MNIYIYFGEMGSGKTYQGKLAAAEDHVKFFDGDDVVPPEMAKLVSNFKPLTREIVHHYVTRILAPEIVLQAKCASLFINDLVVAQALYTNEDRLYLKEYLELNGFDVSFLWVKPSFWRNLKQIYSRPHGLRWVLYWLLNKPFFQKPEHNYTRI